jgi:hypothetical protein
MLSDRIGKWETCPVFERGQNVGICLAGASVIKTATLLGTSRLTVLIDYVSIHESWEDNISEEEQCAKININRLSCIEDCFEKSHNYCSTGNRTAELNIHLEDTVSTKTIQWELLKSNIHGRAAVAKPLITESNAQMCKQWC